MWHTVGMIGRETSDTSIPTSQDGVRSDSPPHISQYDNGGKCQGNLGLILSWQFVFSLHIGKRSQLIKTDVENTRNSGFLFFSADPLKKWVRGSKLGSVGLQKTQNCLDLKLLH